MKKDILNNQSGIALVIALVMLLALTVLGISAITTSTIELQISGNERHSTEALHLADSGLERGLLDLLNDYRREYEWDNADFQTLSSGTQNTVTLPATFVSAFPPAEADWGDPFAVAVLNGSIGNTVDPYGGPQSFGDGKYRVLLARKSGSPDEVYVRGYAEHKSGSRKILQLHLKIEKIDAWRNVVFAGRGSTTATINGNINVAGPIHILGTGDTNEMTISGNAGVFNGYKDLGLAANFSASNLWNRLPTPEIIGTYSGQPIYSLESIFRVKNVQVEVTGSGTIGEAGTIDSDGDGVDDIIKYDDWYYKAAVDAVYANKEIDTKDINKSIYADEIVMPDGYDLGDKIQMPSFEDQYDEQTNRLGQTCSEVGITCNTYKDYITNMAVEVDGTYNSEERCTLVPGSSGTPTFSAGSYTCTDPNDFGTCTCNDANGCMAWNPTAGTDANGNQLPHLWVEGRVEFKDCTNGVNIAPAGETVVYQGKGILYTPTNINVNGDFVTRDKNTDNSQRVFTEDDLIGLMTEKNLTLTQDKSNRVVMGAFFAAQTIATNKPGKIIGSLVSNLFCMGPGANDDGTCGSGSGNAPDIYYVDTLSDAVNKLGMVRSKIVFNFEEYDWEEKN